MLPSLHVTDRGEVVDAADLLATFGEDAAQEAAARADRSRDLGNVIHFCRWRQVERLVLVMSLSCAPGTVH